MWMHEWKISASKKYNCNLEEHHISTKTLHLNNKGNSVFANNILYFIETWISNTDIFDEIRVRHILKDKLHSKSSDMGDAGGGKDLIQFGKYNQNKLAIAHVNINSLRKKCELLTEKTKENVYILLISDILLTCWHFVNFCHFVDMLTFC